MKIAKSVIREAIHAYSAGGTRYVMAAYLKEGSTLSTTIAISKPYEEAFDYLLEEVFVHLGFTNIVSLAFGKDPGEARLLTVEAAYRALVQRGRTDFLMDRWENIKQGVPEVAFRELPWDGRRMLELLGSIGYQPGQAPIQRKVTYVVVGQVNEEGALRQAMSFPAGDLLMSLSPYVKSPYHTVEVRFDKERVISMPHVTYGFLEEMERVGPYRLEDTGLGYDLLREGALEAFLVLHYPLLCGYARFKGFESPGLAAASLEWARRLWGDPLVEWETADLGIAARRFVPELMDRLAKWR